MSTMNNLDFINQFQERLASNTQHFNDVLQFQQKLENTQSIATPQVGAARAPQLPQNEFTMYGHLSEASMHLRNVHAKLVLLPASSSIADLHELLECIGRIEHIAQKVAEIQPQRK